jgi:hypothetical protein
MISAEIVATAVQPVPTGPVMLAALGALYAASLYLVACRRIPSATRGGQRALQVTMNCVRARHSGCGEHLACPCTCHDHHIWQIMTLPANGLRAEV